MAEPSSSVLQSDQAAEPLVYRPLSGLAVAGFVIAAVFSATIAVLSLLAFSTGTPLALGMWVLVMPVAAAILCFLGRQDVRQSEGTRTGLALTTWGAWLSLVFGLGYMAFYGGTYLAVWLQAEDEANKFFAQLKAGKTAEAFNDHIINPAQRSMTVEEQKMRIRYGMMGDGGEKGPLTRFQESEIVRIIQQGGEATEVKALGVQDWEYSKGGYTVKESFRATTPEGVYDLLLTMRSSEGKEFEGRRWAIIWVDSETHILDKTPTPLGITLQNWRAQALDFGNSWMDKRRNGVLKSAYLDTLDPQERARVRLQKDALVALGSMPAAPLEAGLAPRLAGLTATMFPFSDFAYSLYVPAFNDFLAGKHLITDTFEAPERMRAIILKDVRRLFHDAHATPMRPSKTNEARPLPMGKDPNQVRFIQEVAMAIFTDGNDGTRPPKYRCDIGLIIESDPGPLTDRKPEWHIAGIELIRGGEPPTEKKAMSQMRPGAPPPSTAPPGVPELAPAPP